MKANIVFSICDCRITVYECTAHGIGVVDSFFVDDALEMARFESFLVAYQSTKNYILLDVSHEDFHEEQLPHVTGKDKRHLLDRKMGKLFSSTEYTHVNLIKRLKFGRYDDLYLMSGVNDSSFIDPVVDIFAHHEIEIVGVYSLPLMIDSLISPIQYDSHVLLANFQGGVEGKYSFRLSFLDDRKLSFSRHTSLVVDDVHEVVEQFRQEVERTWQYLNNKKILKPGESLQVLIAPTPCLVDALCSEPSAANCRYLYINTADLALQHGCRDSAENMCFSALSAFCLTNGAGGSAHYQSFKLALYRKHQQINRRITWACLMLSLLAMGLSFSNIQSAMQVDNENSLLSTQSITAKNELDLLKPPLSYKGLSPKEMQAIVKLRDTVVVPEALPDHVFTIVSRGFGSFNDLSLDAIEWALVRPNMQAGSMGSEAMYSAAPAMGMGADDMMMDGPGPRSDIAVPAPNILVTLKGSLQNFDGNYRQAIGRIELLLTKLNAQSEVDSAVAVKLPLDIDPSIIASRNLSEHHTPGFEINLTLRSRVL